MSTVVIYILQWLYKVYSADNTIQLRNVYNIIWNTCYANVRSKNMIEYRNKCPNICSRLLTKTTYLNTYWLFSPYETHDEIELSPRYTRVSTSSSHTTLITTWWVWNSPKTLKKKNENKNKMLKHVFRTRAGHYTHSYSGIGTIRPGSTIRASSSRFVFRT